MVVITDSVCIIVGSSEKLAGTTTEGAGELTSKNSGDLGKIHNGKIRSSAHAAMCIRMVRILVLFKAGMRSEFRLLKANKVNGFSRLEPLLPVRNPALPQDIVLSTDCSIRSCHTGINCLRYIFRQV